MLMMAEAAVKSKKKDVVEVIFSIDKKSGKIYGNICDERDERRKIVFIKGYKADRGWIGQLPKNEEKWLCEVVKDTNLVSKNNGALLVKLRKNLDEERGLKIMMRAFEMEPILQFINCKRKDNKMSRKGAELIIEIRKFAEEEIAAKKKYQELKDLINGKKRYEDSSIAFGRLKCINLKYSAADFISAKDQLCAIAAWLERPENKTYFRKRGNRDFECFHCGTVLRLFKSNYKKLEGDLKTRCPGCGASSLDD